MRSKAFHDARMSGVFKGRAQATLQVQWLVVVRNTSRPFEQGTILVLVRGANTVGSIVNACPGEPFEVGDKLILFRTVLRQTARPSPTSVLMSTRTIFSRALLSG